MISASPDAWNLAAGDSLSRVDLHVRFGGRVQGGMTTSTRSPNILLFTEPRVGERHGYFDGWEAEHFHYTGMGQRGDQQLTDINKALRFHAERNLSVRLFRARGTTVTYLGEFEVDPTKPLYQTDAPQIGSADLRQVLVFRLLPVGDVLRDRRDDRHLPSGLTATEAEAILDGAPAAVAHIPIEQQHVAETLVTPSATPYEVRRREQQLVLAYIGHLESQGEIVSRLQVVPTGEASAIRNDIFNETRRQLIEAKGTGSRAAVRMALGQLLDYGRFDRDAARAVLLPTRPRTDLAELLSENGVSAIWSSDNGFEDNAGGQFI